MKKHHKAFAVKAMALLLSCGLCFAGSISAFAETVDGADIKYDSVAELKSCIAKHLSRRDHDFQKENLCGVYDDDAIFIPKYLKTNPQNLKEIVVDPNHVEIRFDWNGRPASFQHYTDKKDGKEQYELNKEYAKHPPKKYKNKEIYTFFLGKKYQFRWMQGKDSFVLETNTKSNAYQLCNAVKLPLHLDKEKIGEIPRERVSIYDTQVIPLKSYLLEHLPEDSYSYLDPDYDRLRIGTIDKETVKEVLGTYPTKRCPVVYSTPTCSVKQQKDFFKKINEEIDFPKGAYVKLMGTIPNNVGDLGVALYVSNEQEAAQITKEIYKLAEKENFPTKYLGVYPVTPGFNPDTANT